MAVILITGCSSGLGMHSALAFAKSGNKVYATMRDLGKSEQLASLAKKEGVNIELLKLDVVDNQSIMETIGTITTLEGRIDVLINNAGSVSYGPIESYSDEEMLASFDTNVIGALRVTRAALPLMRKQRSGKIVNISSISGVVTWPFLGMYSATKHALEAASNALYYELSPFGIDVVLVEPGNFQTDFFKNVWLPEKVSSAELPEEYRKFIEAVNLNDKQAFPSVENVVSVINEIIKEDKPKRRYLVGDDANFCANQPEEEFEQHVRTYMDKVLSA